MPETLTLEQMDAYSRATGAGAPETLSLDEMNAYTGSESTGGAPQTLSIEQMETYGQAPAGLQADPGFDLTLPESFKSAVEDVYQAGIAKPARNIVTGYLASAAGMYNLGANALMLVNQMADHLERKFPLGGAPSRDTLLGSAERWLRDTAARVAPDAEQIDDDVVAQIYQGIGAAPGTIAEYMAGGAALRGPVLGMAAVDALRAADQGPEAALEGAIRGALYGGALKGTGGLRRPQRVGAMAGLGAAGGAAEGGGPKEIAAGATVMGGLGLLGGAGRYGVQDLYRKPPAPPRVEPTLRFPAKEPSTGKSETTETRPPDEPLPAEPGAKYRRPRLGVPRTKTELERALVNRARQEYLDRQDLTPAEKKTAREMQTQALNRLQFLEDEARQIYEQVKAERGSEQGISEFLPELDFEITGVRGGTTTFKLKADPEEIARIRRSITGPTKTGKFYLPGEPGPTKPPPGAPETLSIEEMNARSQAMAEPQRAIEPGERYVGMISGEPTATPGVMPEGRPLTRETVLGPLLKAYGVPVYHGHSKARAAGLFWPKREAVWTRNRSDLEVTSHELAHLLDDRVPEVRRQWNPATKANKTFRDELRGVSYDKKKLYEGFAEFVRLWSTQKEKARAAAPNFYGWLEDFVARNENGPALRQSQADMHRWFAQDATLRGASKIGTPEDVHEFMVNRRDDFTQGFIDDLHGLERAERSLYGDIGKVGMTETARLSRGAAGLVEAAVKYGAPKWRADGSIVAVDKHGRPDHLVKRGKAGVELVDNPAYQPWGLGPILRPVMDDLKSFGLYAVGRRAQHLMAQGRENLFTKAEIDSFIALETPARKQAFADYNRFNKQVLDFAEQAGVIDPAARQRWQTDVYLPFYRVGTRGGTSKAGGIEGAQNVV